MEFPKLVECDCDGYGLKSNGIMRALRSRMEEDPPKNVDQIPILSGNVPDSSGPQKPSFGPGSSRTMNAFFQKMAGLL